MNNAAAVNVLASTRQTWLFGHAARLWNVRLADGWTVAVIRIDGKAELHTALKQISPTQQRRHSSNRIGKMRDAVAVRAVRALIDSLAAISPVSS